MELLHGGQVVASDYDTILVQTPSEGDDTWELRVTLDPGATISPARYRITVQYPSMLPVLTRRIPLSYLQNGFNENWNGRDYLFATLDGSHFTFQIDHQVATYYKLQESYTWDLSGKHVSFSNFDISEPQLTCGSMPSPFPFESGTLAFFQVSVHVRPKIRRKPMKVRVLDLTDFEVAPFDITVRFFPSSFNRLTFFSTFDCTLLDRLRADHPHLLGGFVDDLQAFIVKGLDEVGGKVGAALGPWFLGADYEISDLAFVPASSQPDPWGLGDIVISYVGLPLVDDNGPSNTTGDPHFTSSNPPLLVDPRFLPKGRADAATEDVPYAPRGAGDVAWRPPPAPGGGMPQPPSGRWSTTEPGDLAKVDHIVVVMMENRSFDHMLGYLSREGGRRDIEGLEPADVTVPTQFNYFNGRYYYPTHLTSTQILDSPHHSHENVKAQLADGHGHFVSDYARIVFDDPEKLQQVMGYYGAELTTYAYLADQFTVCDHWFCSHRGPTIPNRFVTLTGDLNRDEYGQPEVNTPDFRTFTPSETPTLFDHLTERGVSWAYFENRVSLMRAFTRHTFDMTNVRGFSDPVNGFEATATGRSPLGGSGGLPSVTFIDPAFGDLPAGTHAAQQDNDDAPPSDLREGQKFISNIVQILSDPDKNRRGWSKTMLVVVYDEHGGFYDHVEPPTVSTSLTGQGSGRLGPRVPAFVVSPWTPARSVLKDTFEHASIPATILRRFCSPHPPSMGPRVDAAADLRGALSLNSPREHRIRIPPVVPSPPSAIMRTAPRRFQAPDRADAYGAFLSGLMLTLGSPPS